MPLVNKPNPVLCLCASCHRDGKHCPRGTTCKMIHDLVITKWSNATFTRWSAHINQMPSLDWNKKVVDIAMREARTVKLTGSTLTAANTATTYRDKKLKHAFTTTSSLNLDHITNINVPHIVIKVYKLPTLPTTTH